MSAAVTTTQAAIWVKQNLMTQVEANAYWAEREWKKYVVTLEGGTGWRPVTETVYVRARSVEGALGYGKKNATRVKRPHRLTCRLATAQDLGCVRVTS
jgi:hypothetical protein